MHQHKKPPSLITIPAWRQVICSSSPWNCFGPPSPKTSLLLFPCSKLVFLVVYNKCCSILALFLISSGVLIFYSSAAGRPLLLATTLSTPFYHSRKLFKRCLKYLDLKVDLPSIFSNQGTLSTACSPATWVCLHINFTLTQKDTLPTQTEQQTQMAKCSQ